MKNTAFVFPGQGSQTVGMLSDFLPQYPVVLDVFAEASSVLGYDLWRLIQEGPEAQLNQTEYTQVAMLCADVAIYRVLKQQGITTPKMMAGHSLGEYAALVCADALAFSAGIRLVAARARLMQQTVPMGVGAMAAIIGLEEEQVAAICAQASHGEQQVTPANYNAIGQVVIAGHVPAVERALVLAEEAGARLAKIIPVSVPCHCPLLIPTAELFAQELAQVHFNTPCCDVLSNVDVSIYQSAQHIKAQLQQQLHQPVRWVATIQAFKKRGIERIIECGPGKVLNGLIKRIDRDFNIISIYDTISLEQVVEEEANSLNCKSVEE